MIKRGSVLIKNLRYCLPVTSDIHRDYYLDLLNTMAEADSDTETLKSVSSDLRRALECPICLDVVRQPFKQCIRGHLMCVDCLRHLIYCPTCEGELTLEDPVCIKNLLEYLPRKCQYTAQGCNKIVQNINDHERFCGFRHIKCRFISGCKHMVRAKDLPLHYKRFHPNVFKVEEDDVKGVCWPNLIYADLPIQLFNNFFWLSFDYRDKNLLKVAFEAIPVGKLDSDYYAQIKFTSGHYCSVFTLKAFPGEHHATLSDEEAEETDCSCMEIPKSMFSCFIGKDGDVTHDLFIFKVEKGSS